MMWLFDGFPWNDSHLKKELSDVVNLLPFFNNNKEKTEEEKVASILIKLHLNP